MFGRAAWVLENGELTWVLSGPMTRYNPQLPHSDVRGVSWDARLHRWQVRFTVDGEYRYFGSYPTQAAAEERARALRGGDAYDPRPAGRPSRSGVRGVIWHPQTGRWHVRLRVNGKQRSFGLYDTVEEAEAAAHKARRGELEPGNNQRPASPRTGRPRVNHEDDTTTPCARTSATGRLPYLMPRQPRRPLVIHNDPFPRDRDTPIPAQDPLRHTRMNPLSPAQRDRLIRLARGR